MKKRVPNTAIKNQGISAQEFMDRSASSSAIGILFNLIVDNRIKSTYSSKEGNQQKAKNE